VVEVNGVPRLACLTRAEDGMTIAPLKNLPRLRDLIVDRSPLDERLATERLYVVSDKPRALEAFRVPEIYKRLIGCLECYGCVSTCPRFDWRNETFGGPYVFVRLAQLHLDPRDTDNRQAQAHSLGIESCRDCAACRCVKGIAIRKDAIETLLDTSKGEDQG
jgi:succinate dehydrogenase/fumarate reductase iron-sulfur protein